MLKICNFATYSCKITIASGILLYILKGSTIENHTFDVLLEVFLCNGFYNYISTLPNLPGVIVQFSVKDVVKMYPLIHIMFVV